MVRLKLEKLHNQINWILSKCTGINYSHLLMIVSQWGLVCTRDMEMPPNMKQIRNNWPLNKHLMYEKGKCKPQNAFSSHCLKQASFPVPEGPSQLWQKCDANQLGKLPKCPGSYRGTEGERERGCEVELTPALSSWGWSKSCGMRGKNKGKNLPAPHSN